jgi:hypothetical protein
MAWERTGYADGPRKPTHEHGRAESVLRTGLNYAARFGRTFTFADPDGYQVTLHDRS